MGKMQDFAVAQRIFGFLTKKVVANKIRSATGISGTDSEVVAKFKIFLQSKDYIALAFRATLEASLAKKARVDKRTVELKESYARSSTALALRVETKLGTPHEDYKKDDGFYKSREWKQIRYLALRNNGAACQCCGARAADGVTLHVDHIVPRYKAPHMSLALDNLQVLCDDCNMGKGAWDSTDWRGHFKSI